MQLSHERTATAIKPWHLFALLGVAFVLFMTPWGTFLGNQVPKPGNIVGGGVTTTQTGVSFCPAGTGTVTKKIAFSNFDPWGGSAVASGTYVLQKNLVQVESLSAAADSTVNSAQTYASGDLIQWKISASNYETQWGQFVVPCMSSADAQASSTNNVKFYEVKLGSWSATITGTGGTTFSTGQTYHFATGVGSTATLTLAVSWAETTSNAGYLGCNSQQTVNYDYNNKVCRHIIMEISDTASSPKLTITGFPRLNTVGTSKYFNVIYPDGVMIPSGGQFAVAGTPAAVGLAQNDPGDSGTSGSMSYQVIGPNVYGGAASFSFGVAAGSLTGSNTENISIKLFYYSDPTYFPANSNYGPDSTQSGSTITITFTVT